MISYLIIDHIVTALTEALIEYLPADDDARAGAVQAGPLQDDPDPEDARISITVHENDPDQFTGADGLGHRHWSDEVYEVECGGAITWMRRFTVKGRLLLEDTGETLAEARQLAAEVRKKIEYTLLTLSFSGVVDSYGEYVSRGVTSEGLIGEMIQGGGPEAYEFRLKIYFDVLTTQTGDLQ